MHEVKKNQHTGYVKYILVWVALLAFTSVTVAIAGMNLGRMTLFFILLIAIIQTSLVVKNYMRIKFDEKKAQIFLLVVGLILLIVFI